MDLTHAQNQLKIAYQQDCQKNGWTENPEVSHILMTISATYHTFSQKKSWFTRLLYPFQSPSPLQGIYLSGPVGRGKTYVMDLFFHHQSQKNKARWHFTEFMQLVHHLLTQFSGDTSQKQKGQPIQQVASHLAKLYQLICLDEFQVTEIGEAMILYRLFDHLIQKGVFFVVTSNCSPSELYKNGLHFDRFEPFIHLIEEKWKILTLHASGKDYRRLSQQPIFQKHALDETLITYLKLYKEWEEKEGAEPAHIKIHKRSLFFLKATPHTLWTSFSECCEHPYGPGDYQAIAKKFQRIFLTHVPYLGAHNRDAARRFITLIDCLYDENVTLYLHSVTDPDHLYTESGPRALPFARTASRLIQMNGRIKT